MADTFLSKLFGRAPALTAEVTAALQELDAIVKEKPYLATPASLLAELLPILFDQAIKETPPTMTREVACAKLAGGVSLLRGEALILDRRAFERRWERIRAVMRRQGQGEAADALKPQNLDADQMVREILSGRAEGVRGLFDANGMDVALGATVLRLTLLPVLGKVRESLSDHLASRSWGQGYCPVCSSWPILAEYRGLEQTRWLRCGLCAAGWEFPRLRCPFCGARDHRQLGYLHEEGEESRCRATTCDDCRSYLKTVSSLGPLSPAQVLVADVSTTHLDLVAAQKGYIAMV